jgi:hypothetical protein
MKLGLCAKQHVMPLSKEAGAFSRPKATANPYLGSKAEFGIEQAQRCRSPVAGVCVRLHHTQLMET